MSLLLLFFSRMRSSSPALAARADAVKPAKAKKAKEGSKKAKDGGSASSSSSKDSGAFRVAVRCRPLLPFERQQESVLTLTKGAVTVNSSEDADDHHHRSSSPRPQRPAASAQTIRSFSFDHVYDEFCTQEEVYAQFVAPFTAQFLAGYNVTLFAYGQTGTGKTHTVIGGDGYEQRGVVPRFVEEVFTHVASERRKAKEAASASTSAGIDADGPTDTSSVYSEAEASEARPLLVESRVESVGE